MKRNYGEGDSIGPRFGPPPYFLLRIYAPGRFRSNKHVYSPLRQKKNKEKTVKMQ